MSKQPDLKTITDVWKDKSEMNYNWEQISKAFENTLSRTGDTPNAMGDDFDVADANILNVNVYKGENMLLNGWDILGYQAFLMHQINILPWTNAGEIVFAPADNEVSILALGTNGQMLKSSGTLPFWGEDDDTDTDTVGVTVQEDGVTVAENVTQIDFLWTPSVLITTPASNQADIDLQEILNTFVWEDSTDDDTNLDPSGSAMFSSVAETRRLDLFLDAGIADAEFGLSASDAYYAMAEGNNYFRIGGAAAPGVWAMGFAFFQADGTSTPNTGTPVGGDDWMSSANTGGDLITFVKGISANTRYVDFYWGLFAVSPGFLTVADFCGRYRSIHTAANNGIHASPTGQTATNSTGASHTCPLP